MIILGKGERDVEKEKNISLSWDLDYVRLHLMLNLSNDRKTQSGEIRNL